MAASEMVESLFVTSTVPRSALSTRLIPMGSSSSRFPCLALDAVGDAQSGIPESRVEIIGSCDDSSG